MKTNRPTPEQYVAFPKAIAALRDRIEATDREIACWIFFDQIKAYGHVHEFHVPPEINLAGLALTDWPNASKENPPFVTTLEGVFFLIADVNDFNPPARYIAYADLLRRWMPHRESKESTANFILSRIHQSRLHDFSPGLGETELSRVFFPSLPDDWARPRPPAEWAMFDLAEVEAIEASDFPGISQSAAAPQQNHGVANKPKKPPRTKQRDQELEIVKIIKQLGYEPMKLPKSPNGHSGVRNEVFNRLKIADGQLFRSLKTFALAWDRCRKMGDIKDAT